VRLAHLVPAPQHGPDRRLRNAAESRLVYRMFRDRRLPNAAGLIRMMPAIPRCGSVHRRMAKQRYMDRRSSRANWSPSQWTSQFLPMNPAGLRALPLIVVWQKLVGPSCPPQWSGSDELGRTVASSPSGSWRRRRIPFSSCC
jgi:hypothetical protein